MDKKEQALVLIKKFQECKRPKILKAIYDLDEGMRWIMMFLKENKNGVYASLISENMGVSRARVGALLKKLEKKDYIIKTKLVNDSRIEIISITEIGKSLISSFYDQAIEDTLKLIETIGYQELTSFLDTLEKIQSVLNY